MSTDRDWEEVFVGPFWYLNREGKLLLWGVAVDEGKDLGFDTGEMSLQLERSGFTHLQSEGPSRTCPLYTEYWGAEMTPATIGQALAVAVVWEGRPA